MARPKKPTAIKERIGNPGKRQLGNPPEPPKPKHFPKPPNGIGDHARKFWKEYGPGLYGLGLLTVADVAVWTETCRTFQRMMDALCEIRNRGDELIEVTDNGFRKSPWLAVYQQERKEWVALVKEFGMTPLARERLDTTGGGDDDELDELINRKKN